MGMGKIFRSRWAALLWAAGIVWTAYDVAEANAPPKHAVAKTHAQSTDAADGATGDQDAALVAELLNGN
jgi:hypothetical protein